MTGDEMPDRRRHGYKELEEKLEAHAAAIEARFRKRYKGMLIAFSIIGLASAIALFGFGYLLDQFGNQQDKLEEQQEVLTKLSTSNRQLSIDIQEQRKDSIRGNCQDTNKRHDDATDALIKAAGEDIQNAPNEAVQNQIKRGRDVSLGLIDLLAPVQDCEKKVKEAVKPVEPVPTPAPDEEP